MNSLKDSMIEPPEQTYCLYDRQVIVRREDLAYLDPLPPNAKMAALYAIVEHAKQQGAQRVGMFAKKQHAGISYATGLPPIAEEFKVIPYIGFPTNSPDPKDWADYIKQSVKLGAIPMPLKPNLISININSMKKQMQMINGFFIPFGFDHECGVQAHAERFNIPDNIGTLIIASMTGITLAGLLRNIEQHQKHVKKIVAVTCGRPSSNVAKTVRKYVQVPDNLQWVDMPTDLDSNVAQSIIPLWDCHPFYELKAYLWLEKNIDQLEQPIYFINVGR